MASEACSHGVFQDCALKAIGKSRAGNTSKIHLAGDACGLPIAFDVTGGHINGCSQAASLIAKVPDSEVIIAQGL